MTRDAAAGALAAAAGAAADGRAAAASRMRRWLGAGAAACVVGWGANQFTPMLLLYRARLGLSAPVVEAHVRACTRSAWCPACCSAGRCRTGSAGAAW